jgi:hypothetical protein
MRFRNVSKKGVVVSLFAGTLLVASVATAAWLASGTGSGSAKAITATNLTTTATTATAQLYPGSTGGDLFIRINNPNPYPVVVTDIARTADPITSDAGAACDAGHAVTMDDQTGLSIAVPASGNTTTTVAANVSMGTSSVNSCQGAVFTIPVTVSGTSA